MAYDVSKNPIVVTVKREFYAIILPHSQNPRLCMDLTPGHEENGSEKLALKSQSEGKGNNHYVWLPSS